VPLPVTSSLVVVICSCHEQQLHSRRAWGSRRHQCRRRSGLGRRAGLPITDVGGAAAQATETALFNDPGIANSLRFLLPALIADNGAIYALNALRVLQPTRINDLDSVFPAENVDRQ